ncbi:MAG: hypothetical protein KZQ64_16590 [gamma proteobacterium symbiont of Bathyaustriella thionipta]|nr:hypothetical protein [gamma proteobacterium symbiont of Bathyaustriella thionipta]MCU7948779.1 hypothetical protein [gamma proteobacterium symbiont of Bathyaustriella thionipta]MCU7954984.1 hypothetical protein [gamma proteobacterium symbiont of Bathyaustriella thionipta]MCU7955312.1 hypothetical protein [gamma proteobacterium symbiont of Bathyaustriella thionipta]MCU7967071.1 hypothetical protein [gamma proteobacterium symbiont of Bathyaustriella thionipta]
MKMLSLGCKTIKDGLTTALIFFITGLSLVLAGFWVMPEIGYLPQIIIFMGALVLLMVPVILVSSYLKNH